MEAPLAGSKVKPSVGFMKAMRGDAYLRCLAGHHHTELPGTAFVAEGAYWVPIDRTPPKLGHFPDRLCGTDVHSGLY